MDAILPAAGSASRMGGIPKFLLPHNMSGETLIFAHIRELQGLVAHIWVPTSEVNFPIVRQILGGLENVSIYTTSTASMTETLKTVLEKSSAQSFLIAMPDTFYSLEKPWAYLSEECDEFRVAAWKIRDNQRGKLGQVLISQDQDYCLIQDVVDKDPNCSYEFLWGAFSCPRTEIQEADSQLPPGEIIKSSIKKSNFPAVKVMSGRYFDCGTPLEYFELINLLTAMN